MAAFLITFKPASENADRGWPLQSLMRLVRQSERGGAVEEKWRFKNQKDVSIGDRVFLLLQGKRGPAIIGYGETCGNPADKQVPIRFDRLLDPMKYALASKDELQAIDGSSKFWRTQSSGISLPDDIASRLEELVIGREPKPFNQEASANPDWTRDELIVALNVYLQHRPNPPNKESHEIAELSRVLNRLGESLFSAAQRSATFRNTNGVYMKLMNFRRLDPQYTAEGKVGLARGAKAEADVWAEFADDPKRCADVALAIVSSLDDPDVIAGIDAESVEQLEEAEEGRLLTRKHVIRERNRKLVTAKLKQAMRRQGKLVCQVCEFDFAAHYGKRGTGFIECHHTKPVATLDAGHKTHIDDLALVCANCHRMIHRSRPWLSIEDLKSQMQAFGSSWTKAVSKAEGAAKINRSSDLQL